MDRTEPDAVEEALTELWMANTLCLTFLALTAIAFACVAWGVPVLARTLAAQGQTPGGATGVLLALGATAAAHPVATLVGWGAVSGGAVAAQLGWDNRRGRIRLFGWGSVVPLALTLAICVAALLA